MKQGFLFLAMFALGGLVTFAALWSLRYCDKHRYRPRFSDLSDIELTIMFQDRYVSWEHEVDKAADLASQWRSLKRMGEILEEIKHRKVGDMDMADQEEREEQRRAHSAISEQSNIYGYQ